MAPLPSPKPKRIDPRSTYTPELAAEICKRIAGGQHVLSFADDPAMPHPSVFYDWVDRHAEFATAVAKARERSAAALIDQAVEIADDGSRDTITIETRGGQTFERVNREWTERSKLRVGMRQWLASRFDPRRFGEKTQVHVEITHELGGRLDMALRYRDLTQRAHDPSLTAEETTDTSSRTREQVIDVTPAGCGTSATLDDADEPQAEITSAIPGARNKGPAKA